MSALVKKEMDLRLMVIIDAAKLARSHLASDNLSSIKKFLDEIIQYERSARIDLEFLLSVKDNKI